MDRLIELDIFKALAAFMVILIHVTATPVVTLGAGLPAEVLVAVNRFAKPSVPMFIFASGVSLYYVYRQRPFRYAGFLGRRLGRILVPYIAWCAVYYAYYVQAGVYTFSIEGLLLGILSGKIIYHLYFVVIIVQFYLLFGVLRAYTARFGAAVVLGSALLANVAAIRFLPAEFVGRCFLTYAVYFMLGCLVGRELPRVRATAARHWPILAAAFVGSGTLYAVQFYEAQVLGIGWRFLPDAYAFLAFSTAAILFYYWCAMRLAGPAIRLAGPARDPAGTGGVADAGMTFGSALRSVLLAVSDGSYYIYLSHPLAIIAAESLSGRLGIIGVIDRMGMALGMVLLTSVPLSILYARAVSPRLKSRARADERK